MSLFHWDNYLQEMQKGNTRLEVWDIYKKQLNKHGFSHFLYADLVNPGDEITVNALHIEDDFPKDWMERYTERDYARNDYFIKHCVSSPQPIIWYSQ